MAAAVAAEVLADAAGNCFKRLRGRRFRLEPLYSKQVHAKLHGASTGGKL